MDSREYGRVHLRLPVRLRWTTPLGQASEVSETIDVSRGGLLVAAAYSHAAGTALWVTFPYDPLAVEAQPEVPAHVVRSIEAPLGDPRAAGNGARNKNGIAVALEPAVGKAHQHNGNGRPSLAERRSRPRRAVSLPVHVRPQYMPWFEETMTLDLSASGARFVTSREYEGNQALVLRFADGSPAGWPAETDVRTRVVRVEALSHRASLAVAVQRLA